MKHVLWSLLLILFMLSPEAMAFIQAEGTKTNTYFHEAATITGGEITDGRDLRDIRWGKHDQFERLVLDIYEGSYLDKGPAVPYPCHFEISYEYYPFRFTVLLQGIRARNAQYGRIEGSALIKEVYMLPYLDDSGIMFGIALNGPVEYEIFELHNPARIIIDLRPHDGPVDLPPVFSLRTRSGSFDYETLGYLEEKLLHVGSEDVRIMQGRASLLFLEEGYYSTWEEGKERLEYLQNELGFIGLFLEERQAHAKPK